MPVSTVYQEKGTQRLKTRTLVFAGRSMLSLSSVVKSLALLESGVLNREST